jgi:lycopene beta-cyclase
MIEFDFAILGGGASGLSLALALAQSPLGNRSILLVEKESKNRNDRTWCYWARGNTPFDGIRHQAWDKIRFVSDDIDLKLSLQPYRYQMIRGIDFYDFMRRELLQFPNVKVLNGMVEGWEDGEESVQIWIDGKTCRTSWVFDSRLSLADIHPEPAKYNYLKQHFKGWEIETVDPVFDPAEATLFDLRTAQKGGLCFFYILPFSEYRGLVEYTLFSPELLHSEEYEQALRNFIHNQLRVTDFSILDEENGIIPMTDHPFPRQLGKRVLSIGARGGRVKPSTGFAFSRIQRDTHAIVNSLVHHNHPFDIPPDSRRHRFYDSIMLDVMVRQNNQVKNILTTMFTRNPVQRVLRFLDDQTHIWEDITLLASLPPVPFLRALRNRMWI